MLKLAAVFLVAISLVGAATQADSEKPTREQIRKAKLEYSAQKSRQRASNRSQKKFVKAQRRAWKKSLKPSKHHARKTR